VVFLSRPFASSMPAPHVRRPTSAAWVTRSPPCVTVPATDAQTFRNTDIGVLAEGRLADVITVGGDPLTDPDLFADPAAPRSASS
jgi:hypothetical protein